MISLLAPSRNRPVELKRMIDSARTTATNPIEILCYISDCDHAYDREELDAIVVRGPRLVFSSLWNTMLPYATGDILQLSADDVVYRTEGWDVEIEKAFASVPDRIVLVHADDGGGNDPNFAELPFVSRLWTETIGYMTPDGYSADFCDTHLNDVADMIGRKIYLPNVLIEHRHCVWGKAPMDKTYEENLERYRRDRPDLLYASRLRERQADAEKLRKVMR